jgi:ankyrin repeat protein
VKKTAAVYAAGNGHAAVLRLLLDHGVPVDKRYDNELTALMWAAAYGRDAAVELLLERGADVEARDNRGKTAADMALESGHPETAARLREGAARRG